MIFELTLKNVDSGPSDCSCDFFNVFGRGSWRDVKVSTKPRAMTHKQNLKSREEKALAKLTCWLHRGASLSRQLCTLIKTSSLGTVILSFIWLMRLMISMFIFFAFSFRACVAQWASRNHFQQRSFTGSSSAGLLTQSTCQRI